MAVIELISLAALALVALVALTLRRELSHAKQQAIDAEAEFNHVFEELPVASQEIDRDGVIRRVNQKFCDLRGLPASDMLGKHCSEFAAESDRERFREEITAKLAGEVPLLSRKQTYTTKDGETITVQVHEAFLHDQAGAIVGLRSTALDVTEHIQKEEEVWQTTSELKAIFQALPDTFLRLDTGGVILDHHGPKLPDFLGKVRQLSGKRLQNLVPAEIGRQMDKAIERVRKNNAMVALDFSLPADAGESSFEARLIPLHWKEIIVIIRDMTERKRAQKRLEQYADEVQEKNDDLAAALATAREATLMKGRFLANMSHEIRTPMNGVLGMTELLLDTPLNTEQREYAEAVQQSAGALLTVTNDILDLSKIEAGRLTIECIPFDVAATVTEIVAWFAARARAKNLELDSILPPEAALPVRGDPGRLRQILTNLIGNAIKFTENGKVVVRMEVIGRAADSLHMKFHVEDTGIGISPEHRNRIFQPFIQGDSSTTRKYGGTGLGLTISKQLVELLGGEIGVDSDKGRGSAFWFTAVFERQRVEEPAAVPAPVAVETSVEPAAPVRLDGTRVLIVAGPSAKTAAIRESLRSWGCEIDELSGAAWIVPELRLAAQTGVPFHIALLDLDLADLDASIGFEITADPLVFDIDLIALSSNHRGDDAQLREKGFSACLSKPVAQPDLHRALVNLRHPQAASAAAPAALLEPEERQPRVLLAEDNLVNQKLVLRLLEKAGLAADVVANGSQAVAAIGKTAYDLVLMDCQMPEMDGFEATAEIRRLEGKTRHTTICALTAHAMAGDRERCLSAGMDDYISKPLTIGVLHKKIAHWLYSKPADVDGSESYATIV